MKLFLRGCCALLLLSTLLLWHPAPARAANEGFNIITSPLPIKLITAPGRTVETELRIKNQSTEPEGIKVGLMKFAATGEDGTPDLQNLSPTDTFASWVHFSPQQFTAPPNVWMTVKMTINVPADASLGYYLAVTFSRANQPGVPEATSVKGAVATLVLLEARTGAEKRNLQLVDFTADHQLYEYLPTNFSIRVRNNGNIYLSPQGNIFISRGGKNVDTLDLNTAGGSVLPASNRLFTVPWNNGFPLFKDRLVNDKPVSGKNGKPKQNLTWNFSRADKFRFGKYTAKLLVVYDDGSKDVPLESTLSFWVLPWKLMLLGLAIILLIGFGVWTAGRSFFRKAKHSVGKRRPNAKS